MKKGFKKNKKNVIIGALFIICVLIFAMIESHSVNQLMQKGNFTIGKYTEWKVGGRGGILHYYIFKVNDKLYEAGQQTGNDAETGHLYFVIFNPADPNESRLLMNIPVPDSIRKVPKNGWSHLPIKLDNEHEIIKKGFR